MKVRHARRRSAVLTPSGLACLATLPTINLTAGCLHDCRYCYIRGYRNYPGESTAVLYEDTPERLRRELARRRTKPPAVYFSPSSDLFQPAPEILSCAEEVLRILFGHGVGVAFLTKGRIPNRLLALIADHAPLVQAQLGLITVDGEVSRLLEPNAAAPEERLEQARRLIDAGVRTEARVDPVVPGMTDSTDALDSLFAALSAAGVQQAAAGVLFLRPKIAASLRRGIPEGEALERLFEAFGASETVGIRGGSTRIESASADTRRRIFDRVTTVAAKHGVTVHVCACKNPDIAAGRCNIAGTWQPARRAPQIPLAIARAAR